MWSLIYHGLHPVKTEAVDNATHSMKWQTVQLEHAMLDVFSTLSSRSWWGKFADFCTEGNLIFVRDTQLRLSPIKRLLPHIDDDGWYHIPLRGDQSKAKWPQPTPGSFNYYHQSSQHMIDCILKIVEPIPNVDWGLHITEMMYAALESSRTGVKYEMTTTLDY